MIPLAKPYFNDQEHLAVSEVLRSGMVSSGKKVEEFEEIVRKYVGAKYAVAVSSCTAGLYLALDEIQKKYEFFSVYTSAFTFPAVQMVMRKLQEKRYGIFSSNLDVDINTYNMIPKIAIDHNVDAIIPIHQFGLSCDMDKVRELANEREAFVLEDAACALGSEYKGEKVGRRGTCVFSFHGRKIVTTGHGGMVCTDDEELYEKVLEGRQFGKDKTGKFVSSGLNFQLSDLQATIGIAQMEKLDEILSLRSLVAKTYDHLITKSQLYENNIFLPTDAPHEGHNWQSYVIRLQGVDRDLVMKRMLENGVQCQVGSYNWGGKECPVSEELAATALALPIWAGMSEEMIEHIVKELETCINNEAIHG